MVASVVLFIVVVAFAWNLGVHYTGAVMGMPYAARVVKLAPALGLIAVFVILGATFASGGVEATVGQSILDERLVTLPDAIVIILAAGLLTLIYNARKVPTSTIQILVFCVVGVGFAGGIPIHWETIIRLAVLWVLAPLVAVALGFIFTRLLDLLIPPEAARAATMLEHDSKRTNPPPDLPASTRTALRILPSALLFVGIAASFVLGANDVANATGAFILTHQFSLMAAGLIGGVAMAIGALTWGRRILRTVAFDLVTMDLTMASAAQGVQALVVLVATTQGLFTSMNQALIGAMAGTGLARGRETVHRAQLLGVLRGWLIGPISGIMLAAILESALRLLTR